jgi:hypothetical protein
MGWSEIVWFVERGRLYVLGLIAASVLASCGGETGEVVTPSALPPIAAKERAAVVPVSKPAITSLGDTERLDVIGLDQFQIQSRLGSPTEDWQHLPAVEAVFTAGRCTLNVTLYPDIRTRIYHALAYKVAGDVDTVKERRRCFAAFAARLQRKPVDSSADTGGSG